jgi:hypothetical protein
VDVRNFIYDRSATGLPGLPIHHIPACEVLRRSVLAQHRRRRLLSVYVSATAAAT